MKEHILRLKRDQDLRLEIEKYTVEHNIHAGAIISCVGSLKHVILRCADGQHTIEFNNNFEIVSNEQSAR